MSDNNIFNQEKAQLNSLYGQPAAEESSYPIAQIAEQTAVEAIISGDISSNFDILAMRGEFSNMEAYAVTRPDQDDDTISIGKAAKNAIIEIDRWIVYRFDKQGQDAVGIVIFDKAGKKYATSSSYFIREFLTLNMLCVKDGGALDKIKVIYKESQNRTADGQKMTYPLCTFA